MKEQITLKLNRVCKHSIRYDATNSDDIKKLSSIYIGNAVIQKMLIAGKFPEYVTVSIEPAEKVS